jgi:copper oxidase (laccase) domain-containing protein
MISKDQPTIFNGKIIAAVSSLKDGNMKFGLDDSDERVRENRRAFFEKVGIVENQVTLVSLDLQNSDFARYHTVNESEKGSGITKPPLGVVDALAVNHAGHALFLPIADCIGAILYDPKNKILMVSHLGRHSTEIYGAAKSVEYLRVEFGCQPEDILVWLSPAVGKAQYPLFAFEGKSLHEVNKEHFLSAGIKPENIEISEADTATHEHYPSHSQHIKGTSNKNGRFAVLAMIPD